MLSEFSTFGISNNIASIATLSTGVVNCFQNLVPLVSATTLSKYTLVTFSCELLSEFSTFGISNNNTTSVMKILSVVNCFQNLVPLVSATTVPASSLPGFSCELLSEFSTFGISNNESRLPRMLSPVVNCFQNLVPLVSATTKLLYVSDY